MPGSSAKKRPARARSGEGADVVEALRERRAASERAWAAVRRLEARFHALEDLTNDVALDLVARWVRAHLVRVGAPGAVVGVSGGVDSSLAACLLARAAPRTSLALLMPCRSDPADVKDALALVTALGLPHKTIDLAPLVDAILLASGLDPARADKTWVGNVASRLRCTLLYLEANRSGRLVLGTGNLDESYIGYSSKGTASDLYPISGLHKHEVRALVRRALAPIDDKLGRRLSRRPATPGYWKGQRAEDELGLRYDDIAASLDVLIGCTSIDENGFQVHDESAFAVGARRVSPAALLHTALLVERGHHKSFGSPALFRPARLRVPKPEL